MDGVTRANWLLAYDTRKRATGAHTRTWRCLHQAGSPDLAHTMNPAQLFNPADRSFTYVIYDEKSREALVIDPSGVELARDVSTLRRMNLRPTVVLATAGTPQAVADAQQLATQLDAKLWQATDGDDAMAIRLGQTQLQVLPTPGYGDAAVCVFWAQVFEGEKLNDVRPAKRHVFTGSTLLIGDQVLPQGASAQNLVNSVHTQLFSLPGTTIVWPGHDDNQRSQSTVALEKSLNRAFVQDKPNSREREPVAALAARSEAQAQVHAAEGYAGDLPPTLAYAWLQSGEAVMVDVRTDAERAWVGQVPGALAVAWKQWPGMDGNPHFDAELQHAVPAGKKVLMLCRSGVRSVHAARRATELGLEAYNILEGFEGDLDTAGHRGTLSGWRRRGLPWQQG